MQAWRSKQDIVRLIKKVRNPQEKYTTTDFLQELHSMVKLPTKDRVEQIDDIAVMGIRV